MDNKVFKFQIERLSRKYNHKFSAGEIRVLSSNLSFMAEKELDYAVSSAIMKDKFLPTIENLVQYAGYELSPVREFEQLLKASINLHTFDKDANYRQKVNEFMANLDPCNQMFLVQTGKRLADLSNLDAIDLRQVKKEHADYIRNLPLDERILLKAIKHDSNTPIQLPEAKVFQGSSPSEEKTYRQMTQEEKDAIPVNPFYKELIEDGLKHLAKKNKMTEQERKADMKRLIDKWKYENIQKRKQNLLES